MRYRDTDPLPETSGLSGSDAVRAILTGQDVSRPRQDYAGQQGGQMPSGYNANVAAPPSTFDRIKLLQIRLNQMGAQPPLVVDGLIGPKTQAAMARYHLDVNGNPTAAGSTPVGGGSSGGGGGGGTPNTATPAVSSQDVETQIRQRYGYLGFLLDDPEIHGVLTQAVNEGWDSQRLTGALMSTNFWRTNSAATRNWLSLQGSDPATAAAQVAQKKADIAQIAMQLGITISDDRLAQMANDALKFGTDATGLQQMIGSEFHYRPGQQTGSIGKAEVDLKGMAGDYLVPLSDQTLSDWETMIAKGAATPDSFRNQIVGLAKGTYKAPWIQAALDQGQTMNQIADPYRQKAAQLLEVAPDSIDFTNPKWARALTQQDPTSGAAVGMDLATWDRTLKSDPSYGWDRTENAQAEGNDFALKLLQAMGRAPA